MKLKVFGHGAYIGATGYANHTRDFFRHLSKYVDIKFRNFTVGSTWEGYNEQPHNNEPYINDIDKQILAYQTLFVDEQRNRADFPIYAPLENFTPDVNLVLEETNHYYYYDEYPGPKIAYNVWESTLQPEGFFNRLKHFDQIWVPSQWQADCLITQGMPSDKIKIVPEGVDTNIFYPEDPQTTLDYTDGRFKFVVFGRWEYRKSTKEIIETFLKEFTPDEPIDLILSVDNPYADDGLESTEDRLKYFGFEDSRIKIKHFLSREDYITYMKNGHVFVSCARSEGWNLPLIEAMACGTPAIYSNCSGQLQYAQHRGLPVKILGEVKNPNDVGNYYEPDFEDLARVMRNAFENYTDHKKRAIEEAKFIHRDFNWDKIAQLGRDTIQEFLNNYTPLKLNTVHCSYLEGPKVEVTGNIEEDYLVEFIDSKNGEIIHSSTIRNNMWTQCSRKYYTDWIIKVNGHVVNKFDLNNERVLVCIESKSIGDTLAWTPYVVEFAKKHNCKVVVSTFFNKWFKNLEAYKDIEWIEPGESTPCKAVYRIGWHRDKDGGWKSFDKYPTQINTIPLQQTATDILGLEFKELNHGIDFTKNKRPIKGKYIVIGPQATSGCKQWPVHHWITLTKLLTQQGYTVVNIVKDKLEIPNAINFWNQEFDDIANYLLHADLFIGLGSGLSWFNWALGKHTVMINGFVEKNHEFQSKVTRIMNEGSCMPCWTNPNFVFDAGDWDWCPIWKGTDKQFICQKSITPVQVFTKVKQILTNKK